MVLILLVDKRKLFIPPNQDYFGGSDLTIQMFKSNKSKKRGKEETKQDSVLLDIDQLTKEFNRKIRTLEDVYQKKDLSTKERKKLLKERVNVLKKLVKKLNSEIKSKDKELGKTTDEYRKKSELQKETDIRLDKKKEKVKLEIETRLAKAKEHEAFHEEKVKDIKKKEDSLLKQHNNRMKIFRNSEKHLRGEVDKEKRELALIKGMVDEKQKNLEIHEERVVRLKHEYDEKLRLLERKEKRLLKEEKELKNEKGAFSSNKEQFKAIITRREEDKKQLEKEFEDLAERKALIENEIVKRARKVNDLRKELIKSNKELMRNQMIFDQKMQAIQHLDKHIKKREFKKRTKPADAKTLLRMAKDAHNAIGKESNIELKSRYEEMREIYSKLSKKDKKKVHKKLMALHYDLKLSTLLRTR
ncbi:MAG: hypothetical protein GY861_27110 [bacterium]|nr:hypothetical protein [bacterium]